MSIWSKLKSWLGQTPSSERFEPIGPEVLLEHTKEFREEVISVTPGVWVAVGFGLANVVLLEGEDGVVLIDSMGSAAAARRVKEAFASVTSKPVKTLILTHNHTDHIFGGGVLAEDPSIPVLAHDTTSTLIDRIVSQLRPIITRRSMRQFGNYLRGTEEFLNAGIGAFLESGPGEEVALRRPTETFGKYQKLEVAGIALELFHAPGETDDQIVVWWPEKRVLIGADNYYKAFPNLYAIRGTAYRDVMQWVRSLDLMRSLRAEFLVPCHSRPVHGEDEIFQRLTHYRDAIQYVYDQTIRWMNRGLTPDEIVQKVQLPEHLRHQPYLLEFYGTVEWSVRSIFSGTLGWFDGNATLLHPLPPREKAERMVALAGGLESFRNATQKAHADEDWQWVLELTDTLLALDDEDTDARKWRVDALRGRGHREVSANGRNYYLTRAKEWEGLEIPLANQATPELVHSIPLRAYFSAMSCNLNPETCLDLDVCIGFRFSDTGEAATLHIRRGVAEVQMTYPDNPELVVTVEATIWKEVVARLRTPAIAFAQGLIQVEGGRARFVRVMQCFEQPK